MNRNILILGGATYQLPAIREAQNRGCHVVVCTNNRMDPGIKEADEYYDISIADHKALIKLAREIGANYVLGYVSETAMHAASAVSEALGLPGVPKEVLQTCVRKDLFRNFQAFNGYSHPNFSIVSKNEAEHTEPYGLTYPLVVKPVDSCGSRGVSRIETKEELPAARQYVWEYSAKNLAIIEEVVSSHDRQFTGDGFMAGGRLEFFFAGEHIFNAGLSKVTACGSLWPADISTELNSSIHRKIEEQLTAIGYTDGPFNADLRVNDAGDVFIIEMAPRNGANYFPQLIQYCTGVDLVAAIYDKMEGTMPDFAQTRSNVAASFILYSTNEGTLGEVTIAPELNRWILHKEMFKQPGGTVNRFQHLGHSIGILNLGFESVSELKYVVANRERLIHVVLEHVVSEASNLC